MSNKDKTFADIMNEGGVVMPPKVTEISPEVDANILANDNDRINCDLAMWHQTHFSEKRLKNILKQGVEDRCDLHGKTIHEAWGILNDFLAINIAHNITVVEVVHGAGAGILRKKTRGWLQNCNYVLGFIEPKYNKNSILVKLKKNNKDN